MLKNDLSSEPLPPLQEQLDSRTPDGSSLLDAGAISRLRVTPKSHTRVQRLGDALGLKTADETVSLLLDLYELNSGVFAPTDIKDLSALMQQLIVMLAALNATHMEILQVIRNEHRGVYTKVRVLARELDSELARVRAMTKLNPSLQP